MAFNQDPIHLLKSCILSLESTKITDRKKGADDLLELIRNSTSVRLIHSQSDVGITWDDIFRSCHNAILRELEKVAELNRLGKEVTCTVAGRLGTLQTLVSEIPKLANKDEPKLSGSNLVSMFLYIHTSNPKTVLNDYAIIILENVLSEPRFWAEINVNSWNDLLKAFKKIYNEPTVKKVNILKAIEKIVKHGCKHSQLLLILKKDILLFLEEVVHKEENSQAYLAATDLQVAYLELCLTVCLELGGETRASLCKFGERILPALLLVYEAKNQASSYKKNALFKLILFLVSCHHPGGASQSPGAYASDWNEWRKLLLKLWHTIDLEVRNVQRNSFFYKLTSFVHRKPFISLAVEVGKQILEMDSKAMDITVNPALDDTILEAGPSTKRRRIEIDLSAIMNELRVLTNPLDMGPWLVILAELTTKYPTIIKSNEFVPLIRLMSDLLGSCNKESPAMDDLCRCCAAILTAQKFIQLDIVDLNDAGSQINAIWETALRTVGLNLSESGSHCLLRHLLSSHFSLEKAWSLLKMFVSGTINLTTDSVLTLEKLLSLLTLLEPSSRECLLKSLLQQLSQYQSQFTIQPDRLARVFIKLITRAELPEPISEESPEFTSESTHLTTAFQLGLFVKECLITTESTNKLETKKVDFKLARLFSTSIKDVKASVLEPEQADTLSQISFLLDLVSLEHSLYYYESLFENHFLDNTSGILENTLLTLNRKLVSYLETTDSKKNKMTELNNAIILYKSFHPRKLKVSGAFFDDESSDGLVKVITRFLRPRPTSKYDSDDAFGWSSNSVIDEKQMRGDSLFDPGLLLEDELLKLLALKLTFYFVCSTKQVVCPRQTELITDLLSIVQNLDRTVIVNLQVSVFVLENVTKIPSLKDDQIDTIIEVCKNVCQVWKTNGEVIGKILSVLATMAEIIFAADEEFWELYLRLVIGCDKFIQKDIFGPAVNSELITCIARILKACPRECWGARLTLDDREISMPVRILSFLKNPYHQSRLCAAKHVPNVFGQQGDSEEAFKTVKDIVEIIFIVPGTQTPEQTLDEGVNRTAVLLHVLASVICCSKTFRRKALLLLLQITVRKRINPSLVESVLKLIVKSLKTNVEAFLSDHFYHLIWNWFLDFKSVDNFPYKFLACGSKQEMYIKFQTDLVCLLFLNGADDGLKAVADKLNKPIPDLLEEGFAKLMAILLPLVTDKKLLRTTIKSEEVLHKLKRNFEVDSDRFTALMSRSIPDIILNFIRILGPESVAAPPMFEFSMVEQFFSYLQGTCDSPDLPLVCYLCCESPRDMQKLLLALTSDIHRTSTKELRIVALERFRVICEILGQNSAPIGSMTHYVLKYVITTLCHFLSEQDEIRSISLNCLAKFVRDSAPHCGKIISTILPVLTSTLIPLVQGTSKIAEVALGLLEYLIVTCAELLEEGIALLDPFPAKESFSKLNKKYLEICYRSSPMRNLENEIKHFLRAGSICKVDASTRIQGLKHLNSLLASKKEELAGLYADLDHIRGFSEDCAESILHRLICMLVQLTSSPNVEVKLEAAKCLGELGAADLKTLTLSPETSKNNQTNHSAENLLLSKALQLLVNSLTDRDICLVEVASKALYLMCATCVDASFIPDKLTPEETEFIHPFISACSKGKKKASSLLSSIDQEQFTVNFTAFVSGLRIRDDQTFETWLTCLLSSIFDALTDKQSFLFSLKAVCLAKPTVGEELLPYICYLLLSNNVPAFLAAFNQYLNDFFKALFEAVNSKTQLKFIFLNHKAVELLLSVIQFIRLRQKRPDMDVLSLNYLHVAIGAQHCSAHFSSVFYAELWWNQLKMETNWSLSYGQSLTSIEFICEQSQEEGIVLQNLLRQAYTNLGDMDAVKGCGSYHLLDADSHVEYYQQTCQWQNMLEEHDLLLSNSAKAKINSGIVSAMKNCGLYNLSDLLLRNEKNESLLDCQYDISWRLSNWSVSADGNHATYEGWHYAALKALNSSDIESVKFNLKEARLCVVESMLSASLQASKNIYPFLSKLHCLQEIEDVSEVQRMPSAENSVDFLDKWKAHASFNGQKSFEFEYLEPLISQRAVILLMSKSDQFPQMCIDIVRTARAEGHYHVAKRHLKMTTRCPGLSKDLRQKLRLEEAQLFWAEDNIHMARTLMRSLLKEVNSQDEMTAFKSDVFRIYGGWMADTNSESAHNIANKYLRPATKVPGSSPEIVATKLAAYDRLALFADFQYQNIQRYIKSDAFQNKEAGVGWQVEVADKLKQTGPKTSDVSRVVIMHSKQSKNDNQEVQNTYKDKDRHLSMAMQCYMKSLAEGDCEDMRVFRVVGLWLENTTNTELMEVFAKALQRIPTYKFIPVLPQLIARLTKNTDTSFTKTLFSLIEKCATEHPHHTLPLIYALANSYKDRETEPTPTARVLGAKALITKLRQRATLSSTLKDMDKVCDAYISLANLPIESKVRSTDHTIPQTEPILQLKNITTVLCPTITLPVNKRGNYSDVVGISSVENTYSTPGGVNAPKKVICVGTDGIKYTQLVKGLDDLRQDAVMQQVFSILNKLLHQDKHTAKRKLLIRTYKIVPMSQRSGVLEWCMNTQPLSMYLLGGNQRNGAHAKYRPKDKSSVDCRQEIDKAQKRNASNEEKLKVFNQICEKIQPVFRYFFFEYFPSPGIWFERRTAYIHSVASSSMVGYILGLGDRHVVNILIDNSTAEVIHIDFGIAFEQGLTLPCPELVPFRLTRDIEDGMGVSGIEGVFRTCCEKTMSVLRANQEIILTTLEVLLYDPLYSWAMTPAEAANFQNNKKRSVSSRNSGESNAEAVQAEVNKTAERALARLRLKLQGMEEEGIATSIEGQVNRLIQQAKDPANLCKLFHGWQAYL